MYKSEFVTISAMHAALVRNAVKQNFGSDERMSA